MHLYVECNWNRCIYKLNVIEYGAFIMLNAIEIDAFICWMQLNTMHFMLNARIRCIYMLNAIEIHAFTCWIQLYMIHLYVECSWNGCIYMLNTIEYDAFYVECKNTMHLYVEFNWKCIVFNCIQHINASISIAFNI